MAAKDTFVPFLPTKGLNSAKGTEAGQFVPVTSQASSVLRGSAPVAPKPHAHGESKVTLQKDGDLVTHILVECSCGMVTEVKCIY